MVDFRSSIDSAKSKLNELKVARKIKQQNLLELQEALDTNESRLSVSEQTRAIIQTVFADIQHDLEYELSNIVTMALAAVFPEPYEFKARFVERRNQIELDMFFVKNGNECEPLESSGFGAVDIASIALRMAVWNIQRTRALMILDEPSRDLSRDMQKDCGEVIKLLSTELGIQIIAVSHIPELIESADRIINVENINGEAKVTIL